MSLDAQIREVRARILDYEAQHPPRTVAPPSGLTLINIAEPRPSAGR